MSCWCKDTSSNVDISRSLCSALFRIKCSVTEKNNKCMEMKTKQKHVTFNVFGSKFRKSPDYIKIEDCCNNLWEKLHLKFYEYILGIIFFLKCKLCYIVWFLLHYDNMKSLISHWVGLENLSTELTTLTDAYINVEKNFIKLKIMLWFSTWYTNTTYMLSIKKSSIFKLSVSEYFLKESEWSFTK